MEQSEIDDFVTNFEARHGDHSRQGGCPACDTHHALAVEFDRRRGWILAQHGFGIRTVAANKVWTTDGDGWRAGQDHEYSALNEERDLRLSTPTPIDHPYCYRDQGKPHRAAALVVHLDNFDKDRIKEFAARHGVIAEFPTDFPSWWYPGSTRMVVYRRDVRVQGSSIF
jgi:hypothetical protein